MSSHLKALREQLAHQEGILVRVHSVQGSGPREQGAWMAVFRNAVVNTVGGGSLEHQAISQARSWLTDPHVIPGDAASGTSLVRYALGPSLGQCCGGVVHLAFERIAPHDAIRLCAELEPARQTLGLFGGGHVGRALIKLLADLPFSVTWIDSRDQIFPAVDADNVVCEHSDPVQRALADLPSGSAVLIMSFSHAEDLDVVAACLRRQRKRKDLCFIGLIGSKTKWASFRKRLEAQGFSQADLAQVTCPIGIQGISGKQPEVVALAVAAQLMQVFNQLQAAH